MTRVGPAASDARRAPGAPRTPGAFPAALLAALALGACGDGATEGDRPPEEARDPVPRDWPAGGRLGYALLDHPRKDPLTLFPGTCTVDAQLVDAAAAGELAQSAGEGVCIVTDERSWIGREAELVPACAGVVTFAFGGATQRNVVCGDAITAPVVIDCASAEAATGVQVVSRPDEVDGDVLGALDVTVAAPQTPTITTPAPQGDGTALWPAGDLRLAWSAEAADAVEVVLGQASGGGPRVRCFAADAGHLTLPSALIGPYRGGIAFVEIATLRQERVSVDGATLRATFRRSDSIWLYPPARP